MPLSSNMMRFPAKSRSNSSGAIAAREANGVVPLLPALAGTCTCTLLFASVVCEPVAEIMILRFTAPVDAFLNSRSVIKPAVDGPVYIKV